MKSKNIRAAEYADEQMGGRYLDLDTPEGCEWSNYFTTYLTIADREEEYYKSIKIIKE